MREHRPNHVINGNSEDTLSEATANIPYKDLFFISDLDKYYKYGKIPYILFTQIFLIILTTSLIIFGREDLSLFRYHLRTMDSTFIPNFDSSFELDDDKFTIILRNLDELINQIDFVIQKIYTLEQTLPHQVKLLNKDDLNLELHNYYATSNHSLIYMKINNSTDNPIKSIGNYDEIRKFITHAHEMHIPVKYEMTVISRGRSLILLWISNCIFNYSSRGYFKFETKHNMVLRRDNESLIEILEEIFVLECGVFSVFIVILAVIQIVIILKRIKLGYQTLMEIKHNLNQDTENSFIEINEDKDHLFFSRGKSKWDLLHIEDKRKFFNLWYFIILTANFLQIMSSINHFIYPILNDTNQLLCAFSCMFTWFGCGYFLEYEDRYYFFYLTIKKSLRPLSQYMMVFAIVFLSFGVLLSCVFNYSEKFYSNLHMAFISSFAGLVGDTLHDMWNSTMEHDPLKTILFSFFYFLTFVAFLLRMLITITEESFDCIKMNKNYYWLDKQISVEDYIKNEIQIKKNNKDEDDNGHYMMSDAIMNVIMNMDGTTSSLPIEIEEIFKARIELLKSKGLTDEDVSKMVMKELKKFIKSSVNVNEECKNSCEEINPMSNDLEFELSKTQSVRMPLYSELIDKIIEDIEVLFNRLDDVLRNKEKFSLERKEYKEIYKMIIAFTINCSKRLSEIKILEKII